MILLFLNYHFENPRLISIPVTVTKRLKDTRKDFFCLVASVDTGERGSGESRMEEEQCVPGAAEV